MGDAVGPSNELCFSCLGDCGAKGARGGCPYSTKSESGHGIEAWVFSSALQRNLRENRKALGSGDVGSALSTFTRASSPCQRLLHEMTVWWSWLLQNNAKVQSSNYVCSFVMKVNVPDDAEAIIDRLFERGEERNDKNSSTGVFQYLAKKWGQGDGSLLGKFVCFLRANETSL